MKGLHAALREVGRNEDFMFGIALQIACIEPLTSAVATKPPYHV